MSTAGPPVLTIVGSFASLAIITFIMISSQSIPSHVSPSTIQPSSSITTSTHELTLYHVHSMSFPSIEPTNMDLGDLAGDIFFDVLYTVIFPLHCSQQNNAQTDRCKSLVHKHSSDDGLTQNNTVVTKLQVDVIGEYAPYAQCKVNATTKKYECLCVKHKWFIFPQKIECSNPSVGRQKIDSIFGGMAWGKLCDTFGYDLEEDERRQLTDSFFHFFMGGYGKYHDSVDNKDAEDGMEHGESSDTFCDVVNAARRIRGVWYSTLDIGLEKGTWRTVKQIKRVDRDCHTNSFFTTVESRDTSCFQECAFGEEKRNTSDPCWMGCFIDSLLGVSNSTIRVGGMTKEEIEDAWSRPFDSYNVQKGGCPDYEHSVGRRSGNGKDEELYISSA